ncbi:hypothetical protein CYMTET_45514 [Cymbomonas tetramitiformis]|uniref:Uncharacterized protein n=1 Tax=Cymbomonas tetramitiformis TaxID=36881 RepID=A0AAE0EYI8_9CHLO|nr:hypothetical protein CYMTET_45514 [Cymbomonas tetramitiformis]
MARRQQTMETVITKELRQGADAGLVRPTDEGTVRHPNREIKAERRIFSRFDKAVASGRAWLITAATSTADCNGRSAKAVPVSGAAQSGTSEATCCGGRRGTKARRINRSY